MGYTYDRVKVTWNTRDEIAFLDALLVEGKVGTVLKYLDSLKWRKRWEGIDKDEVVRFVSERLGL